MIPVYMALLSILLGFSCPFWFGKCLRPVRRLRQGARWIDPTSVNVPCGSELTIRRLREHEKCGEKIVLAHHLADWTRDLQRKIQSALLFNNLLLLILVIVYTVTSDPRFLTSSIWDILAAAGKRLPFSIMIAASFIEVITFVKLVWDLEAKYESLIDMVTPEPKADSWVFFAKR
jgi:hypothetical protein